jgi:hypothetical protein
MARPTTTDELCARTEATVPAVRRADQDGAQGHQPTQALTWRGRPHAPSRAGLRRRPVTAGSQASSRSLSSQSRRASSGSSIAEFASDGM